MPEVPLVREEVAGVVVWRPEDWELLLRPKADAPLWAKLWPSAVALAEALRAGPPLDGRRVVELGAGIALPSVVAQARGAEVLATDGVPEALAVARRNGVAAAPLRFGDPLPDGRWDLVLAADVLHDPRNVAPLLRTLRDDVAVHLADPGRAALRPFAAAAAERWDVDRTTGADGITHLRLQPRTPAGT